MEKILNILMVENSADDAAQIRHVLQNSGLSFDYLCATTIDAVRNALAERKWDVILTDYNLSDFKARDVLAELVITDMEVPLIVLTDHVNEEAAGELMDIGVHDYVIKTDMVRLAPVVLRSLREAENSQRLGQIRLALQKSETRFRAITSNLPGVVFQCLLAEDSQISFPYVSDGTFTLLGLTPQTLMDDLALFTDIILPEDKRSYNRLMSASTRYLSTWNWEGRIQAKGDSDIKWISLRATPRRTDTGATLWDGIMINISRNKLAETEIARSRAQLAELDSNLQKVKERERAHIAREIHDDIGGTLTAIKCELHLCLDDTSRSLDFYQEKAKSVESLVDQVIDSTRRIALDLRPGVLDCGIVAAVRWQVKDFSSRTGITCQLSCDVDEIPLDSDLSVSIFRIFQETLTNISKHANASSFQVTLVEAEGSLLLEVADDGRGVTSSDMEKQNSFGIRGMRERCQQLGGGFNISGSPEKGTRVAINIPVFEMGNLATDPT